MSIELDRLEAWIVSGSQHLYGEEVLKQVAADAEAMARKLSAPSAKGPSAQQNRR